jgi:cytochrome c oxidase subunit 2
MKPRCRQWIPLTLAFTGIALALSGCVPQAASEQGQEIKKLYDFFSYFALAVYALTAGLISWSILRYRKKKDDDELPVQFKKNVGLEILWFAIPQIIVVVLFIASVDTLSKVDKVAPRPAYTVDVTAFQWGWNFQYTGEGVTIHSTPEDNGHIYLPLRKNVQFNITSQDVIHSFYVPEMLIKRDALPGKINHIVITPTDEGVYEGKCAELCGVFHDRMNFYVHVVSDAKFQSWLAEQSRQQGA